jgi:hypothetical protein
MKPNHVLLIAAALLPITAGCLGYPPGSARPGSAVAIQYTATDLATHEVLASDEVAALVLGRSDAGLGDDVDRALLGHAANDTLSVDSIGDPGRGYGQVLERPQELFRGTAEGNLPLATFQSSYGAPAVGQNFTRQGFTATVTAFNSTQVSYRLLHAVTPRQSFPQYGVIQILSVVDDQIVVTLDPIVNATFAGPLPPLNLTEGSYKTLGARDGQLLFGFNADTPTALLERDVHFDIKVVTVASPVPVAGDGAYGSRDSPQLQGDTHRISWVNITAEEAARNSAMAH